MNLQKILTTMIIAMGVLYVVNHVPQLSHVIKGATMFIDGKRVEDPMNEYVSKA